MKSWMEFERLASALPELLERVIDEDSLLSTACAVLGGSAGVLLRRRRPFEFSEKPEEVATYPGKLGSGEALNSALRELREHFLEPSLREIHGLSAQAVSVGGSVYASALWIPGPRSKDSRGRMLIEHEVVVVQEDPAPGSSDTALSQYHAWVVVQLLRRFEAIRSDRLRQTAERSVQRTEPTNVRDSEDWASLRRRLETDTGGMNDLNRTCCCAVWTAYQVRQQGSLSGNVASDVRGFLDVRRQGAGLVGARAVEIVAALLGEPVARAPHDTGTPSKRVKRAVPQGESGFRYQDILTSLLLEHEWRGVREEASQPLMTVRGAPSGRIASPAGEVAAHGLAGLLARTGRLVASIFADAPGSAEGKGETAADRPLRALDIDRPRLRLYFAHLLCASERLRSVYVAPAAGRSDAIAPREVQRLYRLSLSRFMLRAIEVVQRSLGLWTGSPNVTPREVHDALLYLIDRYAHVELGVDERLDIGAQLKRTVGPEVFLYLTHPFYRDHLTHVIDVFLVGHILLHTRFHWEKGGEGALLDWLGKRGPRSGRGRAGRTVRTHWLRNWAVAALFHDIGYAVVGGSRQRDSASIWMDFLGLPRTEPEGRAWENPESCGARRKLADEITKDWSWRKKLCDGTGQLPLGDHGVVSAVGLAQILRVAGSHDKLGGEDERRLARFYDPALHAIAFHNVRDVRVEFESHPLAALLRLCDEIQEWQRKRVDIETMLKDVYLRVLEDNLEPLGARDVLVKFRVNLCATVEHSRGNRGRSCPGLRIRSSGWDSRDGPRLQAPLREPCRGTVRRGDDGSEQGTRSPVRRSRGVSAEPSADGMAHRTVFPPAL